MGDRDYDWLDGIRIRALRAAWKPSQDELIGRIQRWYAKTYHTPLHLVMDLPVEDVLYEWFLDQFEAMGTEEKHNLAIYLLEDDQERRQREAENKNSDDEFMQQTLEKAKATKKGKNLQTKIAEMKAKLNNLSKGASGDGFRVVKDRPMKEVDLPSAPVKDEEIVVVKVDEEFDDGDFVP